MLVQVVLKGHKAISKREKQSIPTGLSFYHLIISKVLIAGQ